MSVLSLYRVNADYKALKMGVRGFDVVHSDGDGYDPTVLHKTNNVFRPAVAYPGRVKHAGATERPPCDIYAHEKAGGKWFMVAFNVKAGPGATVIATTIDWDNCPASIVALEADAYVKCTVLSSDGLMQEWVRYVEGEDRPVSPGEALALGLEEPAPMVQAIVSDDKAFISLLTSEGLAEPDTPVIDTVEEYDFHRIGHGVSGPAPLIRGKHIAGQNIPLAVAMKAASVTFVDIRGGIHRVTVREA